MREVCEDLRPNYAEVAHSAAIELGEAAVQGVAAHVQKDTCDDGFASFIAGVNVSADNLRTRGTRGQHLLSVGDEAEDVGHGNLEEEACGGECVR